MHLAETVTFGGSGLDRAAGLRGDAERIARLRAAPDARVMPLWRGKPLFAGLRRDALGWLEFGHPTLAGPREPELFLGITEGGPRFACDISNWQPGDADPDQARAFFDPTEQFHPALPPDWPFAELRSGMAQLSVEDAELAAMARALFNWHATHGYCARCGAVSQTVLAGWQRDCPACGARHFPRTDPVVIMLVTCGNAVLLGRSPAWPEKMYSLLAGFVEPGETVEAAVRREVFEESAVRVDYLASQPWPYPSSLMIGCHARATSREIVLDREELADARWLSREELLAVFAGENPEIDPARRGAIARFLLWHWLGDRLA